MRYPILTTAFVALVNSKRNTLNLEEYECYEGCGFFNEGATFNQQPTCWEGNMTYLDSGNDGCDWYGIGTNSSSCGRYDTADFKAKEMCCACGGGFEYRSEYVLRCNDQENAARDNGGDGCGWYKASEKNKQACGVYDDGDFDAKDMCCACGGGVSKPVFLP